MLGPDGRQSCFSACCAASGLLAWTGLALALRRATQFSEGDYEVLPVARPASLCGGGSSCLSRQSCLPGVDAGADGYPWPPGHRARPTAHRRGADPCFTASRCGLHHGIACTHLWPCTPSWQWFRETRHKQLLAFMTNLWPRLHSQTLVQCSVLLPRCMSMARGRSRQTWRPWSRLPVQACSQGPRQRLHHSCQLVKELQQGLVSPTVVVLHSQAGSSAAATASLSSRRGPEHLRCEWLLDSAAAWEIKPFDAYRV